MFQSILNFMQSEDLNGNWLDCTDKQYILSVLVEWIENGLEVNKRIQGYINYLNLGGN